MFGAIIGDVAGSAWEFSKRAPEGFELLADNGFHTDDTVCTIAVYAGLKSGDFLGTFRQMCLRYRASYGMRFYNWLHSGDTGPYGSCGNGSAMRVSSVGWMYPTVGETRRVAAETASITHNHPEGVKAAEAVASAIFLARDKKDKEFIREYVEREFGYDLGRPYGKLLDESARRGHCELAQETVPESIICFRSHPDSRTRSGRRSGSTWTTTRWGRLRAASRRRITG